MQLESSVVTLNEEYAKLLLQFGMKDGQIQDFLAMFASFIVDFKKCEGEVRQATELKRRKAAEQNKENGSTKNTDNTTPQKTSKGYARVAFCSLLLAIFSPVCVPPLFYLCSLLMYSPFRC
jgi:hypothetical protein